MTKLLVRFWPPYCNSYKETIVEFSTEAIILRDWLRSIGVTADIVEVTTIERVIEAEL